MANLIKLRKGLDINLKGKAAAEVVAVKEPGFYALVPDDFTGVTPKVVVKEQEYVMAGGPLFIDKNHPEVKFVSPVSGVVTSVERGARRKVMSITVEAAAGQDYEEFGKKDVAKMDAAAVKELLLASGMFAFIKQRPYDVIADPTIAPKAIFVSSFDSNPLAPEFEFALKGEEANFQAGLDALAKIAKTYLSISVNQKAAALTQAKNVTVTVFDGPHPAGNVGVQINHISPINKGETVWTIDAQAVIFIGRLLNTGRVDLTRMVAVGVGGADAVDVLTGQPWELKMPLSLTLHTSFGSFSANLKLFSTCETLSVGSSSARHSSSPILWATSSPTSLRSPVSITVYSTPSSFSSLMAWALPSLRVSLITICPAYLPSMATRR